jgi:hypothetical protein
MNALERLVATTTEVHALSLDRARETEKLFEALKKRLPAVLNQIDYTIGFRCGAERVVRVLALLGFVPTGERVGRGRILESRDHRVQIMEPRDGWNPILQVLN